jgi:hypothetical protein
MDATERSQGQLIAGAGGLLLFIFLFLPWFGVGSTSLSGWEGQSSTDIYLLITALVAIFMALTAGRMVLPGMTLNGATALLGGVSTVVLLWLSVFDFPANTDRKIGVYLSLLAAAAIAYGGWVAAREESGAPPRRSRRSRGERETRPRRTPDEEGPF